MVIAVENATDFVKIRSFSILAPDNIIGKKMRNLASKLWPRTCQQTYIHTNKLTDQHNEAFLVCILNI